jgi:hypothetical protein
MTFRVEYSLKASEKRVGEEELSGFILKAFLLTPICMLGIIGNILSLLVLRRKEMRSTVNCLMFGLAICDNLFLAAQSIVFGFYNLFKYYGVQVAYRLHYDPILTPYYNLLSVTGQDQDLPYFGKLHYWILILT